MKKSKSLTPKEEAGIGIASGEIYFSDYYGFSRIDKITWERDENWVYVSHTEDGVTWEQTKSGGESLHDFKRRYTKVDMLPGDSVAQVIAKFEKDVARAIQDPSFLDIDETPDEETKALVEVGGKEKYETMAEILEAKQRRVEIISALAKEKLDALSTIASKLQKQLSRVMRVIDVLELYLGVSEEIFQLTEGVPESVDHPICIRQLVLFMDEEAAIANVVSGNKGTSIEDDIDWTNVGTFDEWILASEENLDIVLPEKKGIVAIKASRQQRDRYGNTAYERSLNAGRNAKTYLLVRNGENLYRIWINDTMGSRFFPTLEESEDIAKLFENAQNSYEKEEAEDKQISNIRNALLMQGIIDRTDILRPYPKEINFTDPATYGDGGLIKLIRDGEVTLPDGRPTFHDWQESLNEQITRGTRIFNAGIPWQKDGYPGRHGGNYYNWHPPVPSPGVYSVDSIVDKQPYWTSGSRQALKVLYNPGDTIYTGYYDSHERSRRIAFYFYKDDSFILNYDLVDVDDILFYIVSRIERQHFLKLMPILKRILILREEEKKQEDLFIDLVAEEMKCKDEIVRDAVDWWKNKVIFKRPLDQDDKKAWRMIKQRIRINKDLQLKEWEKI